jgi:isopentenyl diphosphate isomerase/L-lactate dehydrogenase-like FMN-dependent dehydrogenase
MRQPRVIRKIHSVEDARYYAQRRLPRFLYQRYEASSAQGITAAANVSSFAEVGFVPRAGRFAEKRDLSTTVLGTPVAFPVLCAPVGVLRIGHPDGEAGVARAAARKGTVAVMSSSSGSRIEDVAAAAHGPVFYQLHYLGGRESAESMIARAKQAGVKALLVTVDSQGRAPARERPVPEKAFAPGSLAAGDLMKAFPQLASRPGWLLAFARRPGGLDLPMAPPVNGRPVTVFNMLDAIYRRTPVWEDIPWIKELWGGPLGVKGVVTADDARRAVDAGADAVVVSNHGGNGLDGRPATLTVLPQIVKAVGDRTEVLMDGGIRRGADVVKAVCLGARAVLIGRAYVFGLMAAGGPGVERILDLMRGGMDNTMAFLGCESLLDLDPSFVTYPAGWQPRE